MAVIEAIQTTYLASDAYIQWTSIPDTYKHLQVVCSAQDHHYGNSANNFTLSCYVNNDNNYSRYATHTMRAYGTTKHVHTHAGWIQTGYMGAEPDIPNYAIAIVDIMDYSNTNKKTVISSIAGYVGTVNHVGIHQNVWHTASPSGPSTGLNGAVDQILINSPGGGGLLRGSCFTLYGIND